MKGVSLEEQQKIIPVYEIGDIILIGNSYVISKEVIDQVLEALSNHWFSGPDGDGEDSNNKDIISADKALKEEIEAYEKMLLQQYDREGTITDSIRSESYPVSIAVVHNSILITEKNNKALEEVWAWGEETTTNESNPINED